MRKRREAPAKVTAFPGAAAHDHRPVDPQSGAAVTPGKALRQRRRLTAHPFEPPG
jgi:hypothetical protein